jgi:hypothetical protein
MLEGTFGAACVDITANSHRGLQSFINQFKIQHYMSYILALHGLSREL